MNRFNDVWIMDRLAGVIQPDQLGPIQLADERLVELEIHMLAHASHQPARAENTIKGTPGSQFDPESSRRRSGKRIGGWHAHGGSPELNYTRLSGPRASRPVLLFRSAPLPTNAMGRSRRATAGRRR